MLTHSNSLVWSHGHLPMKCKLQWKKNISYFKEFCIVTSWCVENLKILCIFHLSCFHISLFMHLSCRTTRFGLIKPSSGSLCAVIYMSFQINFLLLLLTTHSPSVPTSQFFLTSNTCIHISNLHDITTDNRWLLLLFKMKYLQIKINTCVANTPCFLNMRKLQNYLEYEWGVHTSDPCTATIFWSIVRMKLP
jgi:hypothetical protein